jgi:two-component system CheB/CheR fusion protein
MATGQAFTHGLETVQSPSYVVGIEASSEETDALERLFDKMPTNTGMAFIVIAPRSIDGRKVADEFLFRHTILPVYLVEDETLIQPDSIYVISPCKQAILSDGRLFVSEVSSNTDPAAPVDSFFHSLAESCGGTAIAIFVSPTLNHRLRAIQASGGLVVVQSSSTDSNIGARTRNGPLCLTPEEIPRALLQHSLRGNPPRRLPSSEAIPPDEEGLAAILRLLRDQYAVDFSHYKMTTVVRRIERRLQLSRIDCVKEYLERLDRDPIELSALYHDLLVGVTRFFRDEDAFDRLGEEIDNALKTHEPRTEFRAWVAGCATGEEAFSLAILLDERIQASGREITARVFATDIHRISLEHAGHATYCPDSIGSLSASRLMSYFTRSERGFSLIQRIRQMVVFAPHNLLKDAPFTRMNLVTCRNLLIYLQPAAQRKALSLFHFGLAPQGLLFLGPSETTGELEAEFEPVDRQKNIYRKLRDVRLNLEMRSNVVSTQPSQKKSFPTERFPTVPMGADSHILGAYDALLAEFMPPGILMDGSHRLLHVFGEARKYLCYPSGRPTHDVLDCLEGSLKLAVIASLRQIRLMQAPVHLRGVPFGTEILDLTIRPVRNSRINVDDFLITFAPANSATVRLCSLLDEECDESPTTTCELSVLSPEQDSDSNSVASHSPSKELIAAPYSSITALEIQQLATELRLAKENTQALIEELESSNEELQAANEELVASNDQLQRTNEELHSVNEELYTVNAENQRQIVQLTVLTHDMENLLHSTQVHILFLDQHLRIRRFTPWMGEIFNLVEYDIGRSIEAFHNRLQCRDLLPVLRLVLETGRLRETEIQDRTGRWFLMRILPYVTDKGREGVVLTLTDIDVTRRAQMNLHRVIDFFPNAVVATNDHGIIQIVNLRTQSIFGYEAAEMIGQPVDMLLPERLRAQHALSREEYARQPEHTEKLMELSGRRKNGEEFLMEVGLNSINTEKGLLMLASINDVTVRQATQRELSRREEELRLVINGVPMLVAYIDVNRVYRYVNNYYCEKLGLSPDDIRGKRVQAIVGETAYAKKRLHLDRVFAGESVTAELKRVFPTDAPDHETWIQAHYVPDRDEQGQVRGCFVAMSDITELKELVAAKEWQVEQRDLFMATLSHELRNPLGAMTSGLRLLQTASDNLESQRRVLAAIDRQTSQMTALLDDLLDVSRVTKGKIELRRAPTRLNDIVRESVESVMPSFEKRNQTVQVFVGVEPVWVNGDAVRLRQIVNNLLTNACRYSPVGKTISISLDRTSQLTGAIRVKDNGIGIPREMQERVFEPFAQLRRTHNEASEGLGLGLSLSRRLAELHGGTVIVHSEGEGHGSQFTIQLPLIDPPSMESNSDVKPSSFRAEKQRSIVLVEDNEDARDLLRQLLEYEFFQVETAADGLSGLDLIRQVRPQVAMIDIGLPGMNGHEIARSLRKDGLQTYLIALTGYGQDCDRKAAINAGFNEHVTKPLDFDNLLRMLERITAAERVHPG